MVRTVPLVLFATLVIGSSSTTAQQPAGETVIDFENAILGPATACDFGLTGGGGPVRWEMLEDPTSPYGPHVLAETSGDTTNFRFSLCIFPEHVAADIQVGVSFKPVSGIVDQAAGIVVRLLDENNYYIARANALENNVRFYAVEDGRRRQLAGVDVEVVNGEWQQLALRIVGNQAEILLNGQILFTHEDDTFALPGAVGLWTKADSLTYFDNVTITPPGE